MLQFLRKKAQSFLIQAIVVMIALVFIFWGVGANLMNKREAAIVVNGEEISFQQFQQAYDQAYSRLAQQFGGTVPKGLADSLNIKQQVINQLVQGVLLRQGGREMGLMVSGAEIQNEVEGMVQFQENGSFNLERYNLILASNRLSPTKYEESLRYDLLANKTIGSISDFALPASDYEVEDLYNLEKEEVSVSFATVSPSTYIADIEVQESELEAWYQEAGKRYQTAEMVQLTYLPFTYEESSGKVIIEEADIKGYYDQHLTEYQIPEKRHARHILFKATEGDSDDINQQQRLKAEEILDLARNGEDFATLAIEHSEGPSGPSGGELGTFEQGRMVKPFDDAVFSMKQGEISDVVKTEFGYHIIKLEDIQLAGIRSLEETRSEIVKKLQLDQAKPLTLQLANTAYEGIISSGSLTAFLESHPDTNAVETEFFSRSSPPPGITADPVFLEKAFSLKKGELSSLVGTADGFAIISATAIQAPQVPDLNDIREQAEPDYKYEKAAEKAAATANQLVDDIKQEGASPEDIVQEKGLKVQKSGPLFKNSADHKSSFPQSLVQSAFRLSTAAPVLEEPSLFGQDYYVFWFNERKAPDTAISEEDRGRYRELLQQVKEQQILDAWLTNQQAQADISMHNSLENY